TYDRYNFSSLSTSPTEMYTLSLHDALPILSGSLSGPSNSVSWRGVALPPGAASITYRSQLLSRSASGRRLLTKTSDLPSGDQARSEEHTSELQSHLNLVCRLLLEKKKKNIK